MKNFFVSLLLFVSYSMPLFCQYSETKPQSLVKNASLKSIPKAISIFSVESNRSEVKIPKDLKDYTLLHTDKKALFELSKGGNSFISLTMPNQNRDEITLELVEVYPFADDFNVKMAPSMEIVKVSTGRHFRGIIKGQKSSIAAISVFDDQIMGFISHPFASGNLVIGKIEGEDTHILYQDHQLASKFDFECQTKDGDVKYTSEQLHGVQNNSRSLTDCAKLYLEVDNDIYISKGSNITTVTSFVTGIFNQVSTLYSNEQINTTLSELVIWTVASPYNSNSSLGMLNAFTAYRQGFNGNLAQLWSYKASGGIAYVDGLCRTNPDYSMSYAGIQSTYQNVPTYSWTVEVITHEFGHLFGSQHTHACAWNGNNTAIDGCYTTEGGCGNPGLPSGGGTIMSYCHLTSAGINFSNGFGPQPGNIIRSEMTTAPCLSPCSGGGGGGGGGGNECTQNTLTLNLNLDNYPSETSWNIKNGAGTILYSGGPYATPNTLITLPLCLPTACYTFTILDQYGDGICCVYGSGYYNIKQGTNTLITGGQFGVSETKSFCATGPATPTCTDGVQNGTETGIDCGGTCPPCIVPNCTDGILNNGETSIDCGGPNCPACPSCNDGVLNNGETAIDCGGPNCTACATCNDGVQNGAETGIDCGGTCLPCGPSGGSVQVTTISGHYFEAGWDNWLDGGIDCARYSGTQSPEAVSSIRLRDDEAEFSAMTSPTYDLLQYDSVKVEFKFKASSMETGEDFWLRYYNGTAWITVKSYVFNVDFNNEQIYTKTVKITGPLSATSKFRFQSDAGDNTDLIYIDAVIIKAYKTVASATCVDGIQNGSETGIDCGGTCIACPSCNDGIQNGSETGVDCGGSCPSCPSCTDGIQNGNETGIDCGGSCVPCNNGGNTTLLSGHYFELGWDEWIDGGGDCFRYQGPLSPEGQYAIRIRDNESDFSSMTSPVYNLTPYTSVQVEFKFRAVGMEAGKDFWLQYYNGTSWITKATFVSGTNFNNDIVYTVSVNITGALSNVAKFKIICDADSNEDIVYVDAVLIRGTTGSNLIESTVEIIPLKNSSNPLKGTIVNGIHVFPNPTNDLLNIQGNEEILFLNIYNLSGQLISKMKSGNVHQTIDVSDFKEGMYIIKIETEENMYTEKFIKK